MAAPAPQTGKITAIGILKWNGDATTPIYLGMACDVNHFGYFQRGSVKEGLHFLGRTIVQRTQPGQRQSVKTEGYLCHVHVRDNGIAGIVVANESYPVTAAFSVITKVIEDFMVQQSGPGAGGGEASWQRVEVDGVVANAILDPAIIRYQDHTQADKIAKIQKDLDETKIILHQTIDSVLRRGEKLDALVDKSNDLSLASQMFYKQAKKTNSCCNYM